MSNLAKKSVDFYKNHSPRTSPVGKITIHHMAANMDPVECAKMHLRSDNASANYYIGTDGTIVYGVKENRRAWTSKSRKNDNVAITIEVANDEGGPNWHVSDKAYSALIDLCVDICKRYKIVLNWTGDETGTLTCHYMFTPTLCPGPYLKSKMPEIAKTVNNRLLYKLLNNDYEKEDTIIQIDSNQYEKIMSKNSSSKKMFKMNLVLKYFILLMFVAYFLYLNFYKLK